MQVILLEDIKGTGKAGDLVKVSHGYANNFLLPKKKAKLADATSINDLNNKKISNEYHLKLEKEKAEEIADLLSEKTVKIKLKVGDNGKIFGSVTSKEVQNLIKKDFNIDINKKKISIESDVKSCGTYKVNIKLHHDVAVSLNLMVLSE